MLSANGSSKLPRRNGPSSPAPGSAQGSSASLLDGAMPTSPNNASAADGGNTRERMRKRDALIRAKANKDISAKKKAAASSGPLFVAGRKAKPGTVLFMRPNAPLTVSEANSILQVAQTMAAHRADAVLVTAVDGNGGQTLRGILTDKDLAFRVVAQGLDVRNTKANTVMTPNPNCVDPDTPAQDALQKMVDGHFRHLPVTDEDSIYGILDITKCFFQALSKIESAHAKSQALFDALQGVDEELTAHMGSGNPEKLVGFFSSLKDRMSSPDLATVLQREGPPPEVSAKTSVRDAVLLMKETKSTAVLVMDPHEHGLAGIFTSKDVVLRVLAQGLDPATTSIVRVMTPRPDTASEEMTVKEALRKMHDGHYLHLPVVSAISPTSPVGLVNVLQLTYFALEQMQQLSNPNAQGRDANASPVQSEGPLWNKFWNSTFETGSANGKEGKNGGNGDDNESIGGKSASAVHANARDANASPVAILGAEDESSIAGLDDHASASVTGSQLRVQGYVWKLRDPVNNTTYRISTSDVPEYAQIMATTASKVLLPGWQSMLDGEFSHNDSSRIGENVTAAAAPEYPFRLVFIDDENDRVELGSDEDVEECAEVFRVKQHRALRAANSDNRCKVALDLSWISIEAAAMGKRATGNVPSNNKDSKENTAVESEIHGDEKETQEATTSLLRQQKEVNRFIEGRADRRSYLMVGSALAVAVGALFIFGKK